jgi:hypothetical protein
MARDLSSDSCVEEERDIITPVAAMREDSDARAESQLR